MNKIVFSLPVMCSLIFCYGARAQLQIDTAYSPEYLIKKILVNKSSSIIIENISYKGAKQSIGLFKFSTIYNNLIPKGIILSTGNVFDAIGPNNASGTGSKVYLQGDDDLNTLANGYTFDAAVLEFDFVSTTDTISFNYFFASEEYPEYVRKNVNDVFAFFLSAEDSDFKKNLAVLSPGNTPISVDNINSLVNKEYYIENISWDGNKIKWLNNKKKLGELAYFIQYDGLTTLLHAGSKVIPGKKYHLKLAIADVGDRVYDSAIFIEAESFNNTGVTIKAESFNNTEIAKKPGLNQLVETLFKSEIKEYSDSAISVNIYIRFEVDSFNIKDKESYLQLDKVLEILTKDTSIKVTILGHADRTGTEEKNRILSLNRAKTVSEYLLSKGIDPKRIKYSGMGASRPLSETNLSLNRRVEFIFKTGK